MSDTIYVKGVRIFTPHEKAPDFVKGSVIITPNELFQFLKEQEENFTEYNGQKQLRCQLLEGDKGLYLSVDTYKPTKLDKQVEAGEHDLGEISKKAVSIDAFPTEDDLPF